NGKPCHGFREPRARAAGRRMREAHRVLLGGDERCPELARTDEKTDRVVLAVHVMIGEGHGFDDLRAELAERAEEFFRPPDTGESEERAVARIGGSGRANDGAKDREAACTGTRGDAVARMAAPRENERVGAGERIV